MADPESEEQPRCPPAPLFPVLGFFEPQIHSELRVKIAVHLGIEGKLQVLNLKSGSSPDVQMGVAGAFAVIHHENLHLAHG